MANHPSRKPKISQNFLGVSTILSITIIIIKYEEDARNCKIFGFFEILLGQKRF